MTADRKQGHRCEERIVIARSSATKQSREGGIPPGLLRPLAMTEDPLAMTYLFVSFVVKRYALNVLLGA
ncbi:MAG: hypothetical protein LBT00_04110 [Spirochaetaceae bacterium]|nr:hypothetical protein [Spirochaetaceae bacterium]